MCKSNAPFLLHICSAISKATKRAQPIKMQTSCCMYTSTKTPRLVSFLEFQYGICRTSSSTYLPTVAKTLNKTCRLASVVMLCVIWLKHSLTYRFGHESLYCSRKNTAVFKLAFWKRAQICRKISYAPCAFPKGPDLVMFNEAHNFRITTVHLFRITKS